MKTLITGLSCLIAASAFGQQGLPTYGSIEQIKGLQRVYVASDNEDSRKRIIKNLTKNKRLEAVNSPETAEFFIEYSELSREALSTSDRMKESQQRAQMRVYVVNEKGQKVIVWSETRSRNTEHFLGMKMYDSGRSESELTNKFLKALKKARQEK